MAKYLRRTSSGATSSGLGATTKYLRRKTSGAAGSDMSATIKYLRGAAGIRLGTTTKCQRRTTRHRPGRHDHVP
jgi:hypothetical protein